MQLYTHQRALQLQRLPPSPSITHSCQLPNCQAAVLVPCCEAYSGVAAAAAGGDGEGGGGSGGAGGGGGCFSAGAAAAALKLSPKQCQRHGHAELLAIRRLQDCQTAADLQQEKHNLLICWTATALQ